jgi:hypothetical protein
LKRYPNPWFVIPVFVATAAGVIIGRNFARVSCLPNALESEAVGGCVGREIGFAIVGGLVAFVGVAVVAVLVIRSLREWREFQEGERERPTAGCETDEPGEGGGGGS